jgi:hypothetical protein
MVVRRQEAVGVHLEPAELDDLAQQIEEPLDVLGCLEDRALRKAPVREQPPRSRFVHSLRSHADLLIEGRVSGAKGDEAVRGTAAT